MSEENVLLFWIIVHVESGGITTLKRFLRYKLFYETGNVFCFRFPEQVVEKTVDLWVTIDSIETLIYRLYIYTFESTTNIFDTNKLTHQARVRFCKAVSSKQPILFIYWLQW